MTTSVYHKNTPKRQLRNPEKWIGKRIPKSIAWDGYCIGDLFLCDWCQKLFHINDLHELLVPECDEDWDILSKLHIDDCYSFCDDCLNELERKADQIDPCWSHRGWRPGNIEHCPKCSSANSASPNQLPSTTLSIVARGKAHQYTYTRITERCFVLTNLETGTARQFRSDETLWAFFEQLCKRLQDKNTPNQQKAIDDFLASAERYFVQFSQMVNSQVSNYTRRGMEWNLGNYANSASNAAWRYVTYAQQGI